MSPKGCHEFIETETISFDTFLCFRSAKRNDYSLIDLKAIYIKFYNLYKYTYNTLRDLKKCK